ncbi:hypothetical protein BJ991_002373 [Microbacterium immunditiarum]|uniref:Uncharacterized protein n=1 Tax=Microbacterium immunditiarum TaxID=337480 RepID=A0A7Y9GRN2_9MICO|nr:hypothetical protein [Microbacterium immunditiarum]
MTSDETRHQPTPFAQSIPVSATVENQAKTTGEN